MTIDHAHEFIRNLRDLIGVFSDRLHTRSITPIGWYALGIAAIGVLLGGCLHAPGTSSAAISALQITSTPKTATITPSAPAILITATPRPVTRSATATITPPSPTATATTPADLPQIDVTIPPATAKATDSAAESTVGVRYTASLMIDWGTHRIKGQLTTAYRNQTGGSLNEIVFHVPSAERPDAFSLLSCTTADPIDRCVLLGSQLTVVLDQPLTVGDSKLIAIAFAVQVPPMPVGAQSKNGYFGYSARQLNAGDWLPAVAPYQNGSWIVPKPWPTVGETSVTESADYDVTATLSNLPGSATLDSTKSVSPTIAPTDPANQLIIAGPGLVDHPTADTWHFQLAGARNFALSVADFSVTHALSANGVTIELYALPHTATLDPALQQVLHTATTALDTYDRLFGTPCPYTRVAIVEGDFPDGMEFSGIVFIGADWFNTFEGKPDSWLTILTAHELAHQWWYSLVGDDQSQHPMLDETFATYSESLYIEQNIPALIDWWWAFRVDFYKPVGMVDSNVYSFDTERPYIDAVYLRGVEMLRAIRQALGDPAFFAWLRAYAHTQANRIATPAALWGLFSPTEYADLQPIRKAYLHDPDPLGVDHATPTLTAHPLKTAKS